jgi:hypothetical protein
MSNEGHYDFVLKSGTILKFTSVKDLKVQVDNFKTAFSEKNENLDISKYEYIDLRFDNKIYTKEWVVEEDEEELYTDVID